MSLSTFIIADESNLTNVMSVWKSGQELLPNVIRWSKYDKSEDGGIRIQNSLQHSYSIRVFTTIFIRKVRPFAKLDEVLLGDAVMIHDHGEGEINEDVLYIDKNVEGDLNEYHHFVKRFSSLKDRELFDYFQKAFLLQFALKNPEIFPDDARQVMDYLANHHEYECHAFDAIERLDYVLYALEQYMERGNEKILLQTLRGQIPKLNVLADEAGIGVGEVFWTPEVRAMFQQFVDDREGLWIEQKGEK